MAKELEELPLVVTIMFHVSGRLRQELLPVHVCRNSASGICDGIWHWLHRVLIYALDGLLGLT